MNIGLIAHNAKKNLIEDFALPTNVSWKNMSCMRPGSQEGV